MENVETTKPLEMNYFENYNLWTFAGKVLGSIVSILEDRALLMFGMALSGFLQLFLLNIEAIGELLIGVFVGLGAMALFGYIKHVRTRERNNDIFLEKTLVQLGLMIGVIALGIMGTILMNFLNRQAGLTLKEPPLPPGAPMYFTYVSMTILITYYFLKCVSLADEIAPDLLPRWFSAPIRRYRKSGNFSDLMPPAENDPQDETKPTVKP